MTPVPDEQLNEKVEDIKGKQLAFTSPTSNSGFKAPSAILKADYDMIADRDFEPVYSGKHDNSILGVANKDYPAASIANSVLSRMISRDVIKPDQVVSIYKSQTFPTTGFGTVYNLKPELAEKIKLIARQAKVPVIENKPLARSLYRQVDVGRMIPDSLFQAVAEVLAFVYRLDPRRGISWGASS